MRLLCIHLGFMPEEISAKLKPDLSQLNSGRGILIITRDDIEKKELFEQPFSCYKGLSEAISNKQYAMTFSKNGDEISVSNLCTELKRNLEEHLKFNIKDFRIADAKAKLKYDGFPKLSIIYIGQPLITDVYLQFPEMGFQSTLAFVLVKQIFKGLFDWLVPKFKANIYNYLLLDAFGAGGSLHENLQPGTQSEIKGALNIRRFLTKDSTLFKGKNSLRFFDKEETSCYFKKKDNADSLLAQEVVRLYYIKLANHKSKSINRESLTPYLSAPYINNLKKNNLNYSNICESITNSNKEKLELRDKITKVSAAISSLDDLMEQREFLKSNLEDIRQASIPDQGSIASLEKLIQQCDVEIEEIQAKAKTLNPLMERTKSVENELEQLEEKKKSIRENEISKIEKLIEEASVKMNHLSIEDSVMNLEKMTENCAKNTMSCSASFFLDETIKHASNILLQDKAADANMEDDLVIKLKKYVENRINELNETLMSSIGVNFECLRINCDPFKIDMPFRKNFKKYAKETRYSLDSYVNAILWKASGFQDKYLTEDASWSIEGINDPSNLKLFYKTSIKGQESVIDPFWREIATDLLADICNGNAFIIDYIKQNVPVYINIYIENFPELLARKVTSTTYINSEQEVKIIFTEPQKAKDFVEELFRIGINNPNVPNKPRELQEEIQEVQADSNSSHTQIFYVIVLTVVEFKALKQILPLIEEANDLKKQLNDYAGDKLRETFKVQIENLIKKFLNINEFHDKQGKYKIWIRKGSWGDNPEQMLDKLWINSANIDRALYVSTNIIALKEYGEKRISEIQGMRNWHAKLRGSIDKENNEDKKRKHMEPSRKNIEDERTHNDKKIKIEETPVADGKTEEPSRTNKESESRKRKLSELSRKTAEEENKPGDGKDYAMMGPGPKG